MGAMIGSGGTQLSGSDLVSLSGSDLVSCCRTEELTPKTLRVVIGGARGVKNPAYKAGHLRTTPKP